MKCEQVQDIILTDYMDGRLDVAGKKAVDEHLSACQACREFLTAACSTEDIIKRPITENLPPSVWENICEKLEAQPVGVWAGWRHIWAGPSWRPAGIFAASLAVAIFVAGTWMPLSGHFNKAGNSGAEDAALLSYLVDVDEHWNAEDRPYQTVVEDVFGSAGTFSG